MKICTKCKTKKPLTEFSKMKSGKDGLASQCKSCAIEYQRKDREKNGDKINERRRRRRAENLEAERQRDRDRYAANPEVKKTQTRNRRKANPELLRKQARDRYEANKEKIAAYGKAHRAKPETKAKNKAYYDKPETRARFKAWNKAYKSRPEVAARLEVRRVIRRAERGERDSLEIYGLPTLEKAVEVREARLAIYKKYFKRKKRHLDHIRPLAGADGDIDELHRRSHFTNLVYIPAETNLSKHAKPFWEWFASVGDDNLKKCIAEQDAYNKRIHGELNLND